MNQNAPANNWITSLHYSLRRYFVDDFHFRQVTQLNLGSRVLELGGTKTVKRGRFNIEEYDLRVFYLNLTSRKGLDVQGDAAYIPFKDGGFGAVVCSELLEHVPDPVAVLKEVHRVLSRGGTLLLCVPFLYPIHADPGDYGRYTDSFWREHLEALGFEIISLERQGAFFSVLSDMLRELVLFLAGQGRPKRGLVRGLLNKAVIWSRRKALAWDARLGERHGSFFGNYTTGFGVVAAKR